MVKITALYKVYIKIKTYNPAKHYYTYQLAQNILYSSHLFNRNLN